MRTGTCECGKALFFNEDYCHFICHECRDVVDIDCDKTYWNVCPECEEKHNDKLIHEYIGKLVQELNRRKERWPSEFTDEEQNILNLLTGKNGEENVRI